jgi:hypothetical protein
MIEGKVVPMKNARRTFKEMEHAGVELDTLCECGHRKARHWDGWRKNWDLCHHPACHCESFRPTSSSREIGADQSPIPSQS